MLPCLIMWSCDVCTMLADTISRQLYTSQGYHTIYKKQFCTLIKTWKIALYFSTSTEIYNIQWIKTSFVLVFSSKGLFGFSLYFFQLSFIVKKANMLIKLVPVTNQYWAMRVIFLVKGNYGDLEDNPPITMLKVWCSG